MMEDVPHPGTGDPSPVTNDVLTAIEPATETLVDRARSGDRDAYAMLFNRFHDEVYRFATRRLGDPTSGQEVAADTLSDAFAALPRFRWRGAPFEAWLYTIARRRIADQVRARKRSTPLERIPDAPVPDHATFSTDALHVRAILDGLPDADRTVLELRFMEDLDVDQTARRLGKSEGAVRVATHRALMRLRTALSEGTT